MTDQRNEYDFLMADQARSQAGGAIATAPANPDAAGKANRLARQFGVPSDTVLRNLADFERDDRLARANRALDNDPAVTQWVSDPRNAAVTSDDMDQLAKTSAYWRAIGKKAGSISATPAPEPTIWNSLKGLGQSLWSGLQSVGPNVRGVIGDFLPDMTPSAAPGVPTLSRDFGNENDRRARARLGAEADATMPAYRSNWARWVYGGASSTAQMLPSVGFGLLTGSAGVGLAAAGLQTGIPAYNKYRDRGGTRAQAALGGGLEGAIEVATEKLPMGFLVDSMGRVGAKQFIAGFLGRELPGEMVATLSQNAVDTAIANPDKTWSQYLAEQPDQLAQTAVATLMTVGLFGGANAAARRFAVEQAAGGKAIEDADALSKAMDAAANSKARQRDPDAFRDLIALHTQDTPLEHIFVPAEKVSSFFQSHDLDIHDDPFWSGYADQVSEGVATGGDVVIPTADAAAHLSGTPSWDAIRPDVRTSPGGVSLSEAESLRASHEEAMERFGGEVADQIKADQRVNEPRQQLSESIARKLMDAGYTPDAARTQAELVAARAATRASRLGQELKGTAYDNLDVARVLPEALAPLTSRDQLDVVIAAMRRAREGKAPGTPSLLDFIASKGGVEDAGGDIASMGGDQWHREKAFRRKLIRDTASADQATFLAPGTPSENSQESMFRAAIDAGYFPELLGREGDQSGFADKVDPQQFLDAVEAELRGRPRFAETPQSDRTREAALELAQLLDQQGLDPAKATDREIRSAVDRYRQKAVSQGRQFDHSFGKDARGRVTFEQNRTIIELFAKSDLSTFVHEIGHTWAEELKADAERADAPDQIKADWGTVKAWFADNGHAIGEDGSIPVDAHEMWARGVERYVMEGKSPSSALRSVFEAFRSWLLTIYKTVQNLRAPISPEVRAVMDRMVATDEEIAAAQRDDNIKALFDDAATAGMSDAEFAAYRASLGDARSEAFDALLYKTMASVRAARTAEYKDARANVRRDVAEQVASRPEWQAMDLLRDRETNMRLSKQDLVDTFGADVLDLLPKSVPPIFSDKGAPIDSVAELAGFNTGRDMVEMLMGIEARRVELRAADDKRSVRNSVIDEETDAIMADRYGDPLADGSIEREARELIHNDRQGEVIATELRMLARKTRRASDPNQTPTPYALAKQWAQEKVAKGTVRDYTSRSAIEQFRRASRTAAAAAEKAILSGDVDEAFRQKQRQLLNNALIAEATKAADAIDAAVGRLAKVAKRRTSATIDQEYLEQAQALLEAVDLRTRSQVSIDRQGQFESWARAREAEGHDVVVPASFEATLGQTNWSRLSVENLLGLDATVSQILHLGRLKQTLIDNKEQREFDAVVREAVDAAGKLPPRPPSNLMQPSWADRFKSKVASFDAALLKMETIFDWLDGGDSNGVFNRIAFRPISEAQDRANAMHVEYLGRIRDAFSKVPEATVKHWQDRVEVGLINRETGQPWIFTRQQLVAMALNTGNEGNLQRLTDGYGWTVEGVRSALDAHLTAEEWQFVQGIWDTIDGLWPEIEAMERRVNGIAPEKVEPLAFETSAGSMRGGYYPAVYDSAKSYDAERYTGEASDLLEGNYTKATTRASSTKERATKVKRPILLDLGVINRHVGEVIHDITHREAVMNAWKFLGSERVMRAVDTSLGPKIRQQFKPWLRFVANSWAMERAGNEGVGKFVNGLRSNATIVGMGHRLSTIMTQIGGYSNSIEVVGMRHFAPALAQSMQRPIESYRFVVERSGEVRTRMDTLDRDIRVSLAAMQGKGGILANAKRTMFHGIGYMDRVVAVPTWLAGYNKALASGMSEEDAINAGDRAVRMSQGAGAPKDLAAIQRGTGKWGEALKLMTMFYSYLSAFYQRERTLGRDIAGAVRERNIAMTPQLLARAWWLIILPPILTEVLAGRGPDDDEDYGEWAFKKIIVQMLGPLPLARDVIEPAWNKAVGNKTFNPAISPVQRALDSVVSVAGDAGKIVRGEETKRATRDTLEAAGYATGLVPGQLAASAQFLVDVGYGDQDPKTARDWWKGLTTGKMK